jgi:hypothetical protein
MSRTGWRARLQARAAADADRPARIVRPNKLRVHAAPPRN